MAKLLSYPRTTMSKEVWPPSVTIKSSSKANSENFVRISFNKLRR